MAAPLPLNQHNGISPRLHPITVSKMWRRLYTLLYPQMGVTPHIITPSHHHTVTPTLRDASPRSPCTAARRSMRCTSRSACKRACACMHA